MKESDYRLIGACGIYCGSCDVLQAYQEDDEDRRKTVAEQVSKQIGIEVKPEAIKCDGCWGDPSIRFRRDCPMRECAKEKGIHSCGECREFPCKKIDEFYEWGKKTYKAKEYEKALNNLLRIKKTGIEKWLREQQE